MVSELLRSNLSFCARDASKDISNAAICITSRDPSSFSVERKFLNLAWKHTVILKLVLLSWLREHECAPFT